MTKEAQESAKEALLGAAKKLFAEKGLDGTTVRELADAAGVNLSLVSYYFDGKEGLYRTCLEQFGRERLEAANRMLQPPKSVEEMRVRLEMFVEELVRAHFSEPELAAMVHRECDRQYPVIEDIFRNTFMKIFETLGGFFEAARQAGLLRKEVDPFFTTVHTISLIIHPLRMDKVASKYHGVTLADAAHLQKFKAHLTSVLFAGILKEKSS